MNENKKIIFVGPPGTGKTTIKKVFFEMRDPFKYLNIPIEPTRGAVSSVFSFFNIKLGVFDLAGQEIQNWLKDDKFVFSKADIIICVLDINGYLKENLNFLRKLVDILKEMKLRDCMIYIFLHKVDLLDSIYLQKKVKVFEEFLHDDLKSDMNLEFFHTSIAKKRLFKTYDIISNIISKLLKHSEFLINKNKIESFKNDLKIIIEYDTSKQYNIDDLFYDLNLSKQDAQYHLKRLEKLGFAEFRSDSKKFSLTEKVNSFKLEIDNKILNSNENKLNKILENLFYFSNLNLYNEDSEQ